MRKHFVDKESLTREAIEQLSSSIERMRASRKKNALTSNQSKEVNRYRTEFLKFLRLSWQRVPLAQDVECYINYRCRDGEYDAVLEVLSKIIHEFLFFGEERTVLKCTDGEEIEVNLLSVKGE